MVHSSQGEQEVHRNPIYKKYNLVVMPDFNTAVISMTRRYRIDRQEHSWRSPENVLHKLEKKSTSKWKQSISTGLYSINRRYRINKKTTLFTKSCDCTFW